jgi:hypothetical protein
MLEIRSWGILGTNEGMSGPRVGIITEKGNKERRAERNQSERKGTMRLPVLFSFSALGLPFSLCHPQPLPIPLFFVPLHTPPLSPRILSLSSAGVALVTVYLPIRNNDNQPIDLVPP